jgi:hypothetical protein
MTEKAPADSGLSSVYAALPRETPPDHVDAAILAAARRATGSRPRKPALGLPLGWRLPFAVAAVVVLSVSLVTLMIDEGDQQRAGPQRPAAPEPRGLETKPQMKSPAVAERPVKVEQTASSGGSHGELTAKAEIPKKRLADRADAPREPAAAPAVAESQKAEPAAQPSAESSVGRVDARETAQSEAVPAPAAVPMTGAPAAADRGVGRAAMTERAEEVARVRRQGVTAEGRGAAVDQAARLKRLIGDLAEAPPEKWLEKIRELRRDGRDGDADAVLAEFRKRFPAYNVPSPGER